MAKSILLSGGGLDSTALMLWLAERKVVESGDLTVMWFDYGQKAAVGEWESIKYFVGMMMSSWGYKVNVECRSLALRDYGWASILNHAPRGLKPAENKLEGRNVVFVMLAAMYAATSGCEVIYLGYHQEPKDAPFPDATQDAVLAMQGVLDAAYSSKIEIRTPFGQMSREQIAAVGIAYSSMFLTKTFTCYEGGQTECGQCVHCKTKSEVMESLGCVE